MRGNPASATIARAAADVPGDRGHVTGPYAPDLLADLDDAHNAVVTDRIRLSERRRVVEHVTVDIAAACSDRLDQRLQRTTELWCRNIAPLKQALLYEPKRSHMFPQPRLIDYEP
jgi:hypothetical protein